MGCDVHDKTPWWRHVSRDAVVAAGTHCDSVLVGFQGLNVPPKIWVRIDTLRDVTADSCSFEGEIRFGGWEDETLRGHRIEGRTTEARGFERNSTSLKILNPKPEPVAE